MKKFDYTLDFKNLNFRENPHLYTIGKGEQGVLLVEPYKSEILPFWRFKTVEIAKDSSEKIYNLFIEYKEAKDFVGMDMARKFLQMGYTRARRYANHKSGKKYSGPVPENKKGQSGAHGRSILPNNPDQEKAYAALEFDKKLQIVKKDPVYLALKEHHNLNEL
jgi:hypothetical protein